MRFASFPGRCCQRVMQPEAISSSSHLAKSITYAYEAIRRLSSSGCRLSRTEEKSVSLIKYFATNKLRKHLCTRGGLGAGYPSGLRSTVSSHSPHQALCSSEDFFLTKKELKMWPGLDEENSLGLIEQFAITKPRYSARAWCWLGSSGLNSKHRARAHTKPSRALNAHSMDSLVAGRPLGCQATPRASLLDQKGVQNVTRPR